MIFFNKSKPSKVLLNAKRTVSSWTAPEYKEKELPALPSLPILPAVEEDFPAYPKLAKSDYQLKNIQAARQKEVQTDDKEKTTVFIRVKKYKDIVKTIEDMQAKIEELNKSLDKISQIKAKEVEIIKGWSALLQETRQKADDVESKLSTKEEI